MNVVKPDFSLFLVVVVITVAVFIAFTRLKVYIDFPMALGINYVSI